jgi:hypothetical protein
VRSNVKSFEEVRLALQRLSADINYLSGSNPFTVTFTQATGAEAKGGNIQASTPGQFVVSDSDSDFAAFQPGTDLYMLRVKDSEDQGLEWRSPANVLTDIGAAASAHIHPFFHGTFIESFNALVTSNGTVVTMSIEQAGGGDLTMLFSDGATTLDCTPSPATIPLDAGSDTSPTGNFIYILQSTKALTKSTSDWPADPIAHIKIGYFLVPSAGYVQTKGVYANHNINEHAQGTGGLGHIVHITDAIRSRHAIYKTGVVLTMTVAGGGATVDAAVTAGVVRQMHKHTTPALDTATGDAILIINQNGAAYDPVTDLETLTNDANGVAVKKYFNWVIWGIANKGGEYSPLAMNLSTGSYNKQASAEGDINGYDVFRIPSEFNVDSQTGFLIARVTMSLIGGTWAHVSTVDLRGATPLTAAGGASGVTTEFADNAFHLFDEGDVTKEMDFQLSAITAGNTRTITAPDADLDLGLAVTAAAASGAANTVQVSAGADRTMRDAAGLGIFGHAALADNVVIQCKNDAATGGLAWLRAAPHWVFGGGVEFQDGIVDSSVNEILKFASVGSAVNEVTVKNAATGDPALITATGEANAALTIGSSGTGPITFELAGTEKCRVDENGNWCVNATLSPGAANKNVYIYNEGGSAGLYLTVESDTAGNSIFHSYRRAKAGPANVVSGTKLFGFSFYSYQGGAYALVGQWKATMRSTTACDMQYFAGTNDLALTIESNLDVTVEAGDLVVNAGDVVLSAPGSQITLAAAGSYIKHDAAAGTIFNVPTGDGYFFQANTVQAMAFTASVCEWGPSGSARGSVEYATAGRFNIRDSGTNTLIRIEATSKMVFFGGATAIVKPTVSGARDNPEGALKSCLDALGALNLINDTTTVS